MPAWEGFNEGVGGAEVAFVSICHFYKNLAIKGRRGTRCLEEETKTIKGEDLSMSQGGKNEPVEQLRVATSERHTGSSFSLTPAILAKSAPISLIRSLYQLVTQQVRFSPILKAGTLFNPTLPF